MAKDLPYFKFDAAEWINGSITLESLEVQGLFINICAHYWFKSCHLPLNEIKRRLTGTKPEAFQALIDSGIIRIDGDLVRIGFLDEQLNERYVQSIQNSANGRKGGRPKATALISLSEPKAKKSNIEERREEKRENTRTHKSICKVFGKEYKAPQDRMPAEANFYNTIDSQVAELLTVLTQDAADQQIDAYIKHCQKTDRQLIGKAHKVSETILSSDWVKLLGEPPPPDKFKNAAFDKTLWTKEAWEQEYAFDLKNNSAFRKHFGYEELRSSSPMGSNGKP